MLKEDCVDMFGRIPTDSHQYINLVLRNSFVVSVETLVRFEEGYLVCRGREGGTTDEGRGFFVPYEEICYVRLERVVRVGELKTMYGETGYVDAEDRLSATDKSETLPTPGASGTGSLNGAPVPVTVASTGDPGSIAKQNLLNRIRAARANVAGTTGKLGGGNK
jgi:hypothetical protein